jgi:hypothetical protein
VGGRSEELITEAFQVFGVGDVMHDADDQFGRSAHVLSNRRGRRGDDDLRTARRVQYGLVVERPPLLEDALRDVPVRRHQGAVGVRDTKAAGELDGSHPDEIVKVFAPEHPYRRRIRVHDGPVRPQEQDPIGDALDDRRGDGMSPGEP